MSAISKNIGTLPDSDITRELNEAKTFLKEWYQGRSGETGPDNIPYLTADELRYRLDNIDNAIVIQDENPPQRLLEMVGNDEVELRNPAMKQTFMLKLNELTVSNDQFAFIGLSSKYIKQPVIVISPQNLLEANIDFRRNEGKIIPGTLQSLLIHELGHIANPDELQLGRVKEILKHHNGDLSYRTDPREVYTRIMQLRKLVRADPTHKFTIAEIKEIRKRIREDQKAYSKELKEAKKQGIKGLKDLPLDDKLFDPMLFQEFSDKEIMELLNGTAMRSTRELHNEHLPDMRYRDDLVRGNGEKRTLSMRLEPRRPVLDTGESIGVNAQMSRRML